MKPRRDDYKKIEDALRAVYKRAGEFQPSPEWDKRVMAEIRRRKISTVHEDTEFAQQAVWRFAAASITVTLVLSIYAFASGITPDYSLIGLFLHDPFGFAVAQFFIP